MTFFCRISIFIIVEYETESRQGLEELHTFGVCMLKPRKDTIKTFIHRDYSIDSRPL